MNNKIIDKISNYKGIFDKLPTQVPTNGEPDGPIWGNGDIGIVAGGSCENLSFYIGKNDMWCAKPHHIGGGMKTLAMLTISFDMRNTTSFTAIQHIATADVIIELKDDSHHLKITSYAPYQQAIIVTEIECLGAALETKVDLTVLNDPSAEVTHVCNGNTISVTKDFIGDDLEWSTEACAILKIMEWTSCEGMLKTGEKITMITSIQTNHDTQNHVEKAKSELKKATSDRLNTYRTEHLAWWNDFWQSSYVSIPSEPEIEKFWYGSHYILACCSKKGKFPPGIFGNWVTNDTPNWGADYHLNYNYQAPLWGAYSSNKIGLVESYDAPIIDAMPRSKKFAREYLDCNGIYYKVGIGPKGLDTAMMYNKDGSENLTAPFWGQKSNSAYAAVNMLMRFYTTFDEEYARNIAYPYLLEVVAFWEDYLKYENNRYVIYNDCIHENAADAKDIFDWASTEADYRDDFNPILTLGLLRSIFKGALDMSALLGVDEDRTAKWQHILDHMSDFTTQMRNGKTVFRYTERGMDWCDSNSLGIQHVFPAGAIGLSSDKTLLDIAKDTLVELNRWEDYNAFPTFFTAAARIGYDPDIILRNMKAEFVKHGFDNLFIYYGGGGIEDCSAVPSCINEMMFQSHENVLRFFPVWNKSKDAEFTGLRGYGAFIVSASLTNGKVGDINLLSEKGRQCSILCPWESGMEIISNGKLVNSKAEKNACGMVYRFDTECGVEYVISERK